MFNIVRPSAFRAASRAFSMTPSRAHDLAKLTLIGRLGRDPEVRTTQNEKEYVSYLVATRNYPLPPAGPDGVRPEPTTSWHRVFAFGPNQVEYLRTLEKGTRVYVEANYEIREPRQEGEQRQIFLRHENLRIIDRPKPRDPEPGSSESESSEHESSERV